MRLIDADKIEYEDTWVDEDSRLTFKLMVDDEYIDNMPAIDAKPVVHAKWIYEKKQNANDNWVAHCSNCNATDEHATEWKNKVPHCWKCGAKMDGSDTNVGSKEK